MLAFRPIVRGGWSVVFVLGFALPAAAQVKVDPELPEYESIGGVSGNVKSIGSDTMNNLMTLWAEGFRRIYPNVQIEIEGKGSSTAPPALIEGTATFGPMSREMKSEEIDRFEAEFGYKPTQLRVGVDILAVYVNKDNPVPGLTLAEADAIFSRHRRLGRPREIRHWGDVGLEQSWALRPVSKYGRTSASGTYGYFKEHALGGGDFQDAVIEQPGSSAVVQGIANDLGGIGYSGIGYLTAGVRMVPLSADGVNFAPAEPEYAYRGEYPLSRYLLLVVNYKPGSELDPLRREFIRYIYSRQGQLNVIKDGFLPVPAAVAREQLERVGVAWP